MKVNVAFLAIFAILIVCKSEKEHPCDGWILHKEKCYKYTVEETTYELAIDYCKKFNATILKIKTEEENQFLTQLLANNFHIWTDVWLGMTLTNRSRTVKLDDGTEPSYTNWAPNQPDMHWNEEICAEIIFGKWHNEWTNMSTHKGEWNDAVCNDTNAVICEKLLPQQYNGCNKS